MHILVYTHLETTCWLIHSFKERELIWELCVHWGTTCIFILFFYFQFDVGPWTQTCLLSTLQGIKINHWAKGLHRGDKPSLVYDFNFVLCFYRWPVVHGQRISWDSTNSTKTFQSGKDFLNFMEQVKVKLEKCFHLPTSQGTNISQRAIFFENF